MHDPWLDRLSEYIDGELAPAERRSLEQHLQTCEDCRTASAELRQVVEQAHGLSDRPPARDLWAGIAAAIADPAHMPEATDERADDAVVVLPLRSARAAASSRPITAPRRFSFSLPELAAAAVLLMAVGAGATWLLAGAQPAGVASAPGTVETVAGTIMQSADAGDESARLVSLPEPTAKYDADIAELEQYLAKNREQLDPLTVEVVERSLESIDMAVESARAALTADPGNPYLHRQLDSAMQKKLDVLRRASGARRAAT
jgi:hypothetical protein